jgi:hypothetical protein
MNRHEYESRLEWARNLSTPACFVCTGQFGFEPIIIIHVGLIGKDVHFHARCYDVVAKQAADAHALLVKMVLGHVSWVLGSLEMESRYPLRTYAPDRLTFRGDKP